MRSHPFDTTPHEGLAIGRDFIAGAPYYVYPGDLHQHAVIVGRPGTGKTELIKQLMVDDIAKGRGFVFIDTHGEATDWLLDRIPNKRVHDAVLLDSSDVEFPFSFNPLSVKLADTDLRQRAGRQFLAACKSVWREGWGESRMQNLFAHTIVAMMEQVEKPTLYQLARMLTDSAYRKEFSTRLRDPELVRFWRQEFAGYTTRYATEAAAPILNRIGQFLLHTKSRNILCQKHGKVDFRYLMDNRRLVFIRVPTSVDRTEDTKLLLALLQFSIFFAALSRADQPRSERVPCPLYIDGAHNLSGEGLAEIVTDAGAYGLHAVLTHGHVGQFEPRTLTNLYEAAGTILAFPSGTKTAELIEAHMDGYLTAAEVLALNNFELCGKIQRAGSAKTARVSQVLTHRADAPMTYNRPKIREQSRMHVARPQHKVG